MEGLYIGPIRLPTLLIEQAQETIKDTIDAVIHENNAPPSGRGFFWGVSADKDPASEHDVSEQGQHTSLVSTGYAAFDIWPPQFSSCKGCYPYSVSMNERAWSCSCGEDEGDLSSRIARCSLM
jgi:hypothetical protein